MLAKLEQVVLGALYFSAVTLRNAWWRVRRPLLVGVRVIVIQGDQVLLIRHRAGMLPWSLPGGGVERGEGLAEAARRECFEEAGVRVRIERLHGTFDSFFLGMSNYIAVFIAKPESALNLRRSLEIAEARYFPMNALPPNIERGSARRIAELRAGANGMHGQW